MSKSKILNLYAGIGGNRALWGDDYEITAVENNREIALEYKRRYPNDNVIIADAHEFLINNFIDFDFIWSSPPCPTHSKANNSLKGYGIYRYPDFNLYQEIVFLKNFFKGIFVVENVKPYYKPIVEPSAEIDRHFFWTNFELGNFEVTRDHNVARANKETLATSLRVQIPEIKDSRKALRNMVNPKIGEFIFQQVKQLLQRGEGE